MQENAESNVETTKQTKSKCFWLLQDFQELRMLLHQTSEVVEKSESLTFLGLEENQDGPPLLEKSKMNVQLVYLSTSQDTFYTGCFRCCA